MEKFIAKGKAAFGIFRRKSEVSAAKAQLSADGFSGADISVLYPPHPGAQDFPQRQRSSIRNGLMIGAAVGSLVFFVVGLVASVRTYSSIIPYEPVSFLDQMLVILAAILIGGLIGAAAGALVGVGTPQQAGLRYGDYVDAGGILMSVHVNDTEEEKRAKYVLEKAGAQDITLLSEGQGWETVYGKILTLPKYSST